MHRCRFAASALLWGASTSVQYVLTRNKQCSRCVDGVWTVCERCTSNAQNSHKIRAMIIELPLRAIRDAHDVQYNSGQQNQRRRWCTDSTNPTTALVQRPCQHNDSTGATTGPAQRERRHNDSADVITPSKQKQRRSNNSVSATTAPAQQENDRAGTMTVPAQ